LVFPEIVVGVLQLSVSSPLEERSSLYTLFSRIACFFNLKCITKFRMQGDQQNVLSSTTLFVGDLSVTCTENMLLQLFSQCGMTAEVRIIRTRKNASLGYAFVTMCTSEEATAAIEQLNGYRLNGRSLRIGFANEVDNRKQAAPAYNGGAMNSFEDSHGNFVPPPPIQSRGGYSPNTVHYPPTAPVVRTNHPLITSDNNVSLLNAQLNSQQVSQDNSNSVYFKFFVPVSRSVMGQGTDEGIIRDLLSSKCGPNSVSDVSIRRIAEEEVSCYVILCVFINVFNVHFHCVVGL
jgi:RNA recognition motif-containing protein